MLCLKAKVFAEEGWPEYITVKVLFCVKNTNGEHQKITLHCEHKKKGERISLLKENKNRQFAIGSSGICL